MHPLFCVPPDSSPLLPSFLHLSVYLVVWVSATPLCLFSKEVSLCVILVFPFYTERFFSFRFYFRDRLFMACPSSQCTPLRNRAIFVFPPTLLGCPFCHIIFRLFCCWCALLVSWSGFSAPRTRDPFLWLYLPENDLLSPVSTFPSLFSYASRLLFTDFLLIPRSC